MYGVRCFWPICGTYPLVWGSLNDGPRLISSLECTHSYDSRYIVELESQRAEKVPLTIPIPNLSMCSTDQGENTACTYVEHLHSTWQQKKRPRDFVGAGSNTHCCGTYPWWVQLNWIGLVVVGRYTLWVVERVMFGYCCWWCFSWGVFFCLLLLESNVCFSWFN